MEQGIAFLGRRTRLFVGLLILPGLLIFVSCGKQPTEEPPTGAATVVSATSKPTCVVSTIPTVTEQGTTIPLPQGLSQDQALVDFVLRRLAVRGEGPHLIAQVVPQDEIAGRPIDIACAGFLRFWAYHQGQFTSCDRTTFLENLAQDKENPPWKHRYAVFYISSVDIAYTAAAVRLDYLAGPKAGSGTLITLRGVNGRWEVVSQATVWVS